MPNDHRQHTFFSTTEYIRIQAMIYFYKKRNKCVYKKKNCDYKKKGGKQCVICVIIATIIMFIHNMIMIIFFSLKQYLSNKVEKKEEEKKIKNNRLDYFLFHKYCHFSEEKCVKHCNNYI